MPRWPNPRPAKPCLNCGVPFRGSHPQQKYCSRACYGGDRSGPCRFVESRTGYVVLTKGNWRQYEHRNMMEKKLGRKLRPEESVHHRNGVKGDNHPDNLELWAKKHLGGQRVSDLDIWSGTIPPYQHGAL